MFEIDEDTKERVRAQVGIGTLIVFIAMVLVAAIAAGVLIDTAGVLQSKSEETGRQSGEQVTNRIQVYSTTGLKTDVDSEGIGGIQLVVGKAPGANDIDMTGLLIQWVGDSGSYEAVHENVYRQDVDGEFAHMVIRDDDDSLETGLNTGTPVINSRTDRALVVIDLGNNDGGGENDVIGEAYNDSDPNSDAAFRQNGGSDGTIANALDEGDTASLQITTASGTSTRVQVVVPDSLSGKSAVRL